MIGLQLFLIQMNLLINNDTNNNINTNNDNITFNQQIKSSGFLENLENIKNTSSKYRDITTNS